MRKMLPKKEKKWFYNFGLRHEVKRKSSETLITNGRLRGTIFKSADTVHLIINSTNTETEQQQKLNHSKDRDYYIARGQKYKVHNFPHTSV